LDRHHQTFRTDDVRTVPMVNAYDLRHAGPRVGIVAVRASDAILLMDGECQPSSAHRYGTAGTDPFWNIP